MTLEKDAGDGAGFVAAAGETSTVTLTNRTARRTPRDRAVHGRRTRRRRPVHDHLQLAPAAGKVTGHAARDAVGGRLRAVHRPDRRGPAQLGDAIKIFLDANIQITPNGTNRVGASHTFTAHVNVNHGDGGGFVNAPDGTLITLHQGRRQRRHLDAEPADRAPPRVAPAPARRRSPRRPPAPTVSAHTTFTTPQGVEITRNTDGVGANSGPAVKTWVNARISIAPNATNEVGAPHTFTVTLEKDTRRRARFVPAAGEHVDFTLTDSNGAAHGRRRPAPATTPVRTPTRPASARSCSPRRPPAR